MSDSTQPPTAPGLPQPGSPRPEDEVPVYDRGTGGTSRRALVVTAVVALLVGVAGGFVAGRQTAPRDPATLADAVRLASQGKLPTGSFTPGQGGLGGLLRGGNGQNGGQNPQGAPGRQLNRGGIQATVSSVAGDLVTVQTPAGQVQVRIGPRTRIEKAAKGSRSDLAPGSRVLVTLDLSSSSANGTVTAASILSQGAAS